MRGWSEATGYYDIPAGQETMVGYGEEWTQAPAPRPVGVGVAVGEMAGAGSIGQVPLPLPAAPARVTNGGVSKAQLDAYLRQQPAHMEAGQETEAGLLGSYVAPAGGITATPQALPLIGAGIAAVAGWMSLAALKRLLLQFGPKVLKVLIGAAAFKELMDMIGIGAPDESQIKIRPGGAPRRYSIGANPRVRTLQKVSRHCKRMLTRHEKVIREFLPKKQPRYGIPPAKALSAIERAAIRG